MDSVGLRANVSQIFWTIPSDAGSGGRPDHLVLHK